MPVIHVQWLEGRDEGVRRELAEAITDDVVRIAGAPASAVHVVFTDVPRSHWATAGTLRSED